MNWRSTMIQIVEACRRCGKLRLFAAPPLASFLSAVQLYSARLPMDRLVLPFQDDHMYDAYCVELLQINSPAPACAPDFSVILLPFPL